VVTQLLALNAVPAATADPDQPASHGSYAPALVTLLIAALLASSLKVTLPGIEGTLSVNFLFTLLGILELSLPETLMIGLASTLAQFYWRPARRFCHDCARSPVRACSCTAAKAARGFVSPRRNRLQAFAIPSRSARAYR